MAVRVSADGHVGLTPSLGELSALQASDAADQVSLQRRFRSTQPTTTLREGQAMQRRPEGCVAVAESVFVELGQFHGGRDGDPARTSRQSRPCFHCLQMAPKPAQQVGAVHGDPFGCPRSLDRRRA